MYLLKVAKDSITILKQNKAKQDQTKCAIINQQYK